MQKLGFTMQDLTKELARQYGYAVKEGVIVLQVASGSPAQFAGLKPGVLILEANRKTIRTVQDFMDAIEGSKSVLLLIQEGRYSRYVILQMG